MSKINIYIIARISKDAHQWVDKVCGQLDDDFVVFKPKDNNPWNQSHGTFPKRVFDVDLQAIKASHIGLMLPEYGSDCAWESGWYAHSEKPLVIFINNQRAWLRDWMVKGGVDYVITISKKSYVALKRDPILKYKRIMFIKNMSNLNRALKTIYNKHYGAAYQKSLCKVNGKAL